MRVDDREDATGPANVPSGSERSLTERSRRYSPLLGTLLVVVGLVVAVRRIDGGELVATIASADPSMLAIGAAVYAASWPLRGRRYEGVLSAMGHRAGTALLTAAVFVSQAVNLAVPARAGDVARAYVVHERVDVPYTAGAASLAVERLFDLVTVSTIAGVAVGWLAVSGAIDPVTSSTGTGRTVLLAAATVSTATVGLSFVVVTAVWTDRANGIRTRVRARVEDSSRLSAALEHVDRFGALEIAHRFAEDVGRVVRRPRVLVVVGATSFLIWAIDVLTAVIVLVALDSGLAGGQLLVIAALAVSVGNLAKVLPLSQGGVGLYEAGFTALVVGLTPLGAGVALAAAALDHALKNVVTVIGGGGAAVVLGLSLADAGIDESAPDGDRQSF